MSPSIDRLSGLPDEVIFHILSFLPTKTSASTNVLAKRWRFLWAHVPNLDFYDHDFKGETQDSDVIHRVIVLHRAITMNTFHLSLVKCSEYQLATWITHAVNRCFRNLFLDLKNTCNDDPATFTLPRCLFTCKTLVEAEIRCVRWITLSGKVFWPSLKKLNLTSIMFEDDRCLPRLLSGCPVLEELTVEVCEIEMEPINYDSGLVFISSPTIKILNVNLDYGCHKFKINAPSVVCLNVINCCLEDITSLTTMTSLIEAHISLIGDWDEDVRVINNTEHATTRFLNSLCNVKCLKFSVRNGEILGKGVSIAGLETLVKFDKLTKLEFNLVFDFDEIAKFLQVADNLQVLIITLCGMHNTFREPKQVPTCMLSRLKTVQITLFDDFSEHDFEMISYLKRKAQVLERIKIHSYSHLFSKNKIPFLRIRLTMIPSGSKSCQLVLS